MVTSVFLVVFLFMMDFGVTNYVVVECCRFGGGEMWCLWWARQSCTRWFSQKESCGYSAHCGWVALAVTLFLSIVRRIHEQDRRNIYKFLTCKGPYAPHAFIAVLSRSYGDFLFADFVYLFTNTSNALHWFKIWPIWSIFFTIWSIEWAISKPWNL